MKIDGVEGHVAWRGMVGRCLEMSGSRGLRKEEVERQEEEVGERIRKDIEEVQKSRTPEPEPEPEPDKKDDDNI